MANITLKGNPITTAGTIPQAGDQLPDFNLVNTDLSRANLASFAGSKLVLNIFPSIDTGTCAASVRAFNAKAAALDNTKILNISKDLPFAHGRFCAAEGIKDAVNLSDFADGSFGQNYNLNITNGPLADLHSRVVIVADDSGKVLYSEQVGEIVDEPNYDAALAALG